MIDAIFNIALIAIGAWFVGEMVWLMFDGGL